MDYSLGMTRRSAKLACLLAITPLLLTGCSTWNGLKNDVSGGFNALGGAFSQDGEKGDAATVAAVADPNEAKKKLPVYDGTCPPVTVRPDLSHLVEFYDAAKPSVETKVSEATITNVQNICRVEGTSLSMQVDISLTGKTGPKARVKPSDKPSFAYPYFVAVTDAQGTVLSKEIFAASVSYGSDKDSIGKTESIFQTMPLPDKTAGQVYNVVVGFQLTMDQLAYNQKNPVAVTAPAAAPAEKSGNVFIPGKGTINH